MRRDIAIVVGVVLLMVIVLVISSSRKTDVTKPNATEAAPSHADQQRSIAELKEKQKVCDKFIKLAFSNGVFRSYRGPLVKVGPQWNAMSYEDKNRIASTMGECLYLKQDPSQPRILGFLDYYTGKRIAHLDPDGELATD